MGLFWLSSVLGRYMHIWMALKLASNCVGARPHGNVTGQGWTCCSFQLNAWSSVKGDRREVTYPEDRTESLKKFGYELRRTDGWGKCRSVVLHDPMIDKDWRRRGCSAFRWSSIASQFRIPMRNDHDERSPGCCFRPLVQCIRGDRYQRFVGSEPPQVACYLKDVEVPGAVAAVTSSLVNVFRHSREVKRSSHGDVNATLSGVF